MTKQVIVWRGDLKVRKGKIAAQASHASLAVFTNRGRIVRSDLDNSSFLYIPLTKEIEEWLNNSFTKICVYCNTEKELESLYEEARKKDIPCSIITDNGKTEFNGVPTKTCIAIGPAESKDIDAITGHLPLL